MKRLLRHRPYLRHLSEQQRRAWFEQWKHANPRLAIGQAWLPPNVLRSFAYIELTGLETPR